MCEHFQNSRKLSDSQKLTEILSELLDGRVSNRSGTAEIVDTRLKYGLQKCRLSIERKESNGATERLISQVFEGRFKAPDVEISAKLDFGSSLPRMQHEKTNALEVTIKNKSSAHIAYRLFDLVPNNLGVQLIALRPNNTFQIGDQFNITLNYRIENATKVFNDGDHRVFEIAPHQTVRISAAVTTPRSCVDEAKNAGDGDYFHGRLAGLGYTFVGYRYAFIEARFLERLVNWDPSIPNLMAPTEDAKLLNSNHWKSGNSSNDPYPGWTPFNTWIAVGKGENPKLSPGRVPTQCWTFFFNQAFPRQ